MIINSIPTGPVANPDPSLTFVKNKIITDLTGYSERDLEIGVGVVEAFNDFLKWIFEIPGPFFMIAHNGDKFDHLIFKKWTEGKISKNDNFRMMFLDTYVLAKLKFPGEKSYKLGDLAKQIGGLKDFKSHNALDDCMTTLRIFEKLM
jgi:DNA polymerase III alpha subunit (gram-positive type)